MDSEQYQQENPIMNMKALRYILRAHGWTVAEYHKDQNIPMVGDATSRRFSTKRVLAWLGY